MKRNITTLALTGIAFITACSFTTPPVDKDAQKMEISNPKDVDVAMILSSMNITTKVDEKELDAKYGAVKLDVAVGKGLKLDFSNPLAKPYSLDVYDTDGNLVASINDIISPAVALPASMFSEGGYLYKLSGDGVTYAGKFFYQ